MKNAFVITMLLLFNCFSNLFGQQITTKPLYWVNLGVTKIIWKTKYVYGLNYQMAPNHIIGFECYQFGELEEGGIIFEDEIPNRVRESKTVKLTYGYQINPKNQHFKIIPSIGIGSTSGLFRNNNLISNSWGKNYEEIEFRAFLFHHKLI